MTFVSRCLLILSISLILSDLKAQFLIKRIIINGKEIVKPFSKNIKLSPSEDDLLIEFEAIPISEFEYSFSVKNDLVKWQKTGYPTAHFQNITGGEYLFQIKAISTKTTPIFAIEIIKENTFWQEKWFWPLIIFYACLVIGVVTYLFYLYDFRQKLKMLHVRNQIAADLHDEVGSNLNSIAIFTEVLRKTANEKSMPILDKITANSKESVSLMQDTVWMINPKNDSTEKLFDRMKSFASGILASKNISLEFVSPLQLNKAVFTMDQRKNCYLVFKEAINNIVKHAEATKVEVTINQKKEEIEIKIKDNGKGFDIYEIHDGNGLQNFKERAKEAEFDLTIDSVLEKGTMIEMRIMAQ
jgi:two-component sensor histidine kinase